MKIKELFKKHWMVLLVPFGVLLDQITKLIARNNLTYGKTIWIIDGLFGWTLSYNTGAAFSFLSGATWLLAIISIVMTIAIAYLYYVQRNKINALYRIILCLILAGAIGNGIDRVFIGKVTDFINFNFFILFNSSFPIFNVADIFVTCCMFLLFFLMFFDKKCNLLDFDKKEKKDDSTNH